MVWDDAALRLDARPAVAFSSAMAGPVPARLLDPHPSMLHGRSRRAATSLVRQRALQHRQWHHRAAGWFATASNPRRSPHEAAVSAQKPLPQSRWASTTRAWVERHRKGLRCCSAETDPVAALSCGGWTRKMATKLQTGGHLQRWLSLETYKAGGCSLWHKDRLQRAMFDIAHSPATGLCRALGSHEGVPDDGQA